MNRSRHLFLSLCGLLLTSCSRPTSEVKGETALLSRVKSGLVERDRKLYAFHLEGSVTEAGTEARFTFDYRSPHRMRGTLHGPPARTLSFDGTRLYSLDGAARQLTRTALTGSGAESTLMLNQLFAPFAPEGYRAPLFSNSGTEVRMTSHPRTPEAVELRVRTRDPSIGELTVTYLLRWPALDFLEKRTELGEVASVLAMQEETCTPELKLCLPRRLLRTDNGRPGALTRLSAVRLNTPLPTEAFTLTAPSGFAVAGP